MRENSPGPSGLAGRRASAALHGLFVVSTTPCAARRAPCIRSFSRPTRLTGHTEIGSLTCVAKKKVETQRSTPPLFFIRPGCSGIVPSPGDGESGTRRHAHA